MKPSRFPAYGWAGLVIILLAEGLLLAGVEVVATFFTPLVWSGYVLFIDGVVFKKKWEVLPPCAEERVFRNAIGLSCFLADI